jgi:hypothetical protein
MSTGVMSACIISDLKINSANDDITTGRSRSQVFHNLVGSSCFYLREKEVVQPAQQSFKQISAKYCWLIYAYGAHLHV